MEISARNSRSLVVCWLLIVAAVGYVAVRVNVLPVLWPAQTIESESISDDFQLRLAARIAVGAKQMQQATDDNKKLLRNIDKVAQSDQERICAAIVAGEVVGRDEALDRLRQIQDDDAASLQRAYQQGAESIDAAERARLIERYGWFAELALVSDRPPDDPQRQAVLSPARKAMGKAMVIGVGLLLVGLIAMLMFIVTIALLVAKVVRPTFVPVTLERPVFLEAFAIYIVCFVFFLGIIVRLLHVQTMSIYLAAFLIVPIGLYWPVRRGASWAQSLAGFGWHRGRGIVLEPLLGIGGYLALLPVAVAGFLITIWLAHLAGITPSHPVVRQLFGSTRQIVMVYLLACIWAPIMEETFFRGALYNHLRGGRGFVVSSLIVGLLFALVHPQGWTTIPALGSIGMVLAWIREWRASILASIAAHAVNNGVVITIAVLLLR